MIWITDREEHRQLSPDGRRIQMETESQESQDERPLLAERSPAAQTNM